MYETNKQSFVKQKMLSIFKYSFRKGISDFHSHSLEGSMGGTNVIIEGVTQNKRLIFALLTKIIQPKDKSCGKSLGQTTDNRRIQSKGKKDKKPW